MVVEPELISTEILRKADWNQINLITKNIFENANIPLRMILKFAVDECGIKHGDCDSVVKSLSLHRNCSVGILVDDESVRFAKP